MDVSDIDSLEVKGFLDPDEGMELYGLALEASRLGPLLEIGGYCGKSTLYLGLACKKTGGILYSIDHHRGSEEQQRGQEYYDPDLYDEAEGKVDTFRFFRRTIEQADLLDTVVPIVAPSNLVARMWSTPLAFVFIDGEHSYAAAFTDYTSWSPHIIPGGILAIHDIFIDPAKGGQAPYFVYKLALASGLYAEKPLVKTLGVLRRLEAGEVPGEIRSKRDW
jgi:predicted O-methyltransferase YrrM